MVDLGSIHTYEKDQPFFTKGWSSREIGMLASITNFLNNTDALEFKTVPAIRVTASGNLGKSISEVVQTDRRHKFGLFDKVYFIGTS